MAIAINTSVRVQEEKNKIFTIYYTLFTQLFSSESRNIGVLHDA